MNTSSCLRRLLGALFCISLITACGGGGGGGNDNNNETSSKNSVSSASNSSANGTVISSRNKTSHNAGQNCLSCHSAGGAGASKAIFRAAGTVYKSANTVNTSATVKLYLHNTNNLKAELPTDKNGNFYTTETVEGLFVEGGPLVDGVDAVVIDSNGGEHTMPGLVTNGSCNSCHGASVGKITVN